MGGRFTSSVYHESQASSFFTFLTVSVSIVSIASVNSMPGQKPEGYTADDAVNLNPDPTGPILPQVNGNPEPIFKANKGTLKDKLVDINLKIDKNKISKRNGKLEKIELKTFGEHYQTLGKNPKNFTEMSPDRLVWIVQAYYPGGFEHPKVGLIDNAQVVGIYDAETGNLDSQSFRKL